MLHEFNTFDDDDWSRNAGPANQDPVVVSVKVSDITVPPNWRAIDGRKVKALATSIREVGLQNPITIRLRKKGMGRKYILVAGAHRLSAHTLLQLEDVSSTIMNSTSSAAFTDEENILRSNLSPFELADAIKRCSVNLTAKTGVALAGMQPHDRNISRISRRLGLNRSIVRNGLAHAEISPRVRELLITNGLDKRASFLTALTKLQSDEEKIAVIKEKVRLSRAKKDLEKAAVKRKKAAMRGAHEKSPSLEQLKEAWSKSGFMRAYNAAKSSVQRDFKNSI